MRHCKQCNKPIPSRIKIDGKTRDLKNRKFCFDCSSLAKDNLTARSCTICNKILSRKSNKGKLCWTCTNRINRQEKIQKLQNVTGGSCWFCNYNRCWAAIEFHHVKAATKKHNLSKREMQYTWERIINEAQKCVLACACCHREIHQGLITQTHVETVWADKWKDFKTAA